VQVRRAAYLYRQPTLKQQLRVAGGWAQVRFRGGKAKSWLLPLACCVVLVLVLQPASNHPHRTQSPLLQAASKQLREVLAEAAGRGAAQR